MAANQIHPSAFIAPDVEIGSGNVVMPYAVILGPCRIGDDNWIGPHATIGAPGQMRADAHPAAEEPQGRHGIEIGNGNRIREFVTVHQGTSGPTRICDGCYLMVYSNVSHDTELEDGVTIASATQMGGRIWIGQNANIGLGVDVHQSTAIGALTMIGMNSTVVADIPPFALAMGSPARVRGANRVGLSRSGLADANLTARIDEFYRGEWQGVPDLLPEPLAGMAARFLERSSGKLAR